MPHTYTCSYCEHKFTNKNLWSIHVKQHLRRRNDNYKLRNRRCQEKVKDLGHVSEQPNTEENDVYYDSWQCGNLDSPPGVCCIENYSNTSINDSSDYRSILAAPPGKGHVLDYSDNCSKDPNKCSICGKYFAAKSNVKYHEKAHTGEKTFKCDICGKQYTYSSGLETHKKTHSSDLKYACNVCGKQFFRKDHCAIHETVHSNVRPFMCEACKKCFKQPGHLMQHVLTHTKEKKYPCPMCDKTCASPSSYYTHKKRHSALSFPCKFCSKSFGFRSLCVKHMREHHSETYRCEKCDREVSAKNSFKCGCRKKKCAWGSKLYKCDMCDKTYATSSSLSTHKRIHNKEKCYACTFCGRLFPQKERCKVHERTHTGERPYKCDQCPKTFRYVSGAIGHRRTHTGETPYQCIKCQQSFKQKLQLKRHYKTHTKEVLKCKNCQTVFQQKVLYIAHVKLKICFTGTNLHSEVTNQKAIERSSPVPLDNTETEKSCGIMSVHAIINEDEVNTSFGNIPEQENTYASSSSSVADMLESTMETGTGDSPSYLKAEEFMAEGTDITYSCIKPYPASADEMDGTDCQIDKQSHKFCQCELNVADVCVASTEQDNKSLLCRKCHCISKKLDSNSTENCKQGLSKGSKNVAGVEGSKGTFRYMHDSEEIHEDNCNKESTQESPNTFIGKTSAEIIGESLLKISRPQPTATKIEIQSNRMLNFSSFTELELTDTQLDPTVYTDISDRTICAEQLSSIGQDSSMKQRTFSRNFVKNYRRNGRRKIGVVSANERTELTPNDVEKPGKQRCVKGNENNKFKLYSPSQAYVSEPTAKSISGRKKGHITLKESQDRNMSDNLSSKLQLPEIKDSKPPQKTVNSNSTRTHTFRFSKDKKETTVRVKQEIEDPFTFTPQDQNLLNEAQSVEMKNKQQSTLNIEKKKTYKWNENQEEDGKLEMKCQMAGTSLNARETDRKISVQLVKQDIDDIKPDQFASLPLPSSLNDDKKVSAGSNTEIKVWKHIKKILNLGLGTEQ